VAEVRALFKEAKEEEKDFRKKANESLKFRYGEQWDEQTKTALKDANRAALNFNLVGSNLRLLSGYQRRNRTDIRYFPTENGDSRIADILSIVVKKILDLTNYHHEETLVFNDEQTVGRGLFHLFVSFDKNFKGKEIRWSKVKLQSAKQWKIKRVLTKYQFTLLREQNKL